MSSILYMRVSTNIPLPNFPARFLTTMPLLTTLVLVLTFFGCASVAKECAKTDMLTMADSPYVRECLSDVGFGTMLYIKRLSEEQLAVVCSSPSCEAHIKLVEGMSLGDCIIPETTIYLYTDVIGPYRKRCAGIRPKDSSSSTSNDSSVSEKNVREESSSTSERSILFRRKSKSITSSKILRNINQAEASMCES
ncbi:unnamed protein product [Peronospora belbahrii]|uniref:Elicitin n=1 Tax=Peronospora belbahrii TaxID=622444 RepID=A0AAU9L1I5_9STRA|nr:unnamed protein product [Peronospora belbahrii]